MTRNNDKTASGSSHLRRKPCRKRRGKAMNEIRTSRSVAHAYFFMVGLVHRRLQAQHQQMIDVVIGLSRHIPGRRVAGVESADPSFKAVTAKSILVGIVFPEFDLDVLHLVAGDN